MKKIISSFSIILFIVQFGLSQERKPNDKMPHHYTVKYTLNKKSPALKVKELMNSLYGKTCQFLIPSGKNTDSQSGKYGIYSSWETTKGLSRNKLVRIGEVILCGNKAKNVGIAIAKARLFNAVSVQNNKPKWISYFLTSPKDNPKGSGTFQGPLSKNLQVEERNRNRQIIKYEESFFLLHNTKHHVIIWFS